MTKGTEQCKKEVKYWINKLSKQEKVIFNFDLTGASVFSLGKNTDWELGQVFAKFGKGSQSICKVSNQYIAYNYLNLDKILFKRSQWVVWWWFQNLNLDKILFKSCHSEWCGDGFNIKVWLKCY